ncbi:histidinol-phosphate transaminase [bacterium]|nr:MAG: histidinol-phosphate transaminase [bacterium]
MNLVRKDITNISPYLPGKPIEETKRELGLRDIIKLASNENAFGPSPKAIEAIKKNLFKLNRYPDSQSFYLKKKLAKSLGLDSSNIVMGNGSDELIDVLIKTFVEPEENIVTSDTTFLEYEIIARINGRKIITVPMKYFKYDLVAIRKKINQNTKMVFISNPNNPTGTYVSRYELEDFLRDLPEKVILVLDEAYDNFIDVDDFPNSLGYLRNKNVIVMKTFSKTYGLAGLRVGYCLGRPEFTTYMERVRQPFNVNLLAQAAAAAALDDKKFLRKTREKILIGKNYIYDSLNKLGIAYVPSVANFVLINTGRDTVAVFKDMLKFGVIVRDMKQYGLKNFIRVTIGNKQENERFVRVFKKIL